MSSSTSRTSRASSRPVAPMSASSLPLSSVVFLVLLALALSFQCPLQSASAASPVPKSRPVPIAIDFGSEYIKVSSVRPGAGAYHIVVDEQSKRKVPAVVAFEGGERHFGNGATGLTTRKPKDVYWYAHRLAGKRAAAESVATMKQQGWPYEYVPVEGRGTVGVVHTDWNGEEVVLSAEELLAMSLEHIIKISEADAETLLTGASIVVPNFFSQAERQAMLDSAELAGLNVFSLINENTAAAIQYGIDRSYTNETQPHIVLLYNMGASSTKVSIVQFTARQVKESTFSKKNKTEGALEVLSLGYDEKLGGQYFENVIVERVLQYVDEQLKAKGKSGGESVRSNARVVAKVRSAADKAKNVLSANQDTHIHLASLIHDMDFKLHITREQFYEWAAELIQRVPLPIEQALKDANLTADQLHAVAIIGGGVRVPAVQQAIKAVTGVSLLTQSLNGDEAMAMGAEFKAIELSKQFKTRGFTVEDITPYGVTVKIDNLPLEAEAEANAEDDGWTKSAALFKRYNKLSKKKTVTFTHDRDFTAELSYDESSLPFLPLSVEAALLQYNVTGLVAAQNQSRYAKLFEEGQKPKVSVVFLLDSSGLVSLTSAEATMDEMVEVPVTRRVKKQKNETIEMTDPEAAAGEESTEGESKDDAAASTASDDVTVDGETAAADNGTDSTNSTATKTNTTVADEYETITEYKNKKVTHKIPLTVTSASPAAAAAPMSLADKRSAKARLSAFRAQDEKKKSIAMAKNSLEAFIYNSRNTINEGRWDEVSVGDQRDALFNALNEAEEWLYEQKDDDDAHYVAKLAELEALASPIRLRYTELTELPKAIEASMNIFNFSNTQVGDYAVNRKWVSTSELQRLANMTIEGEQWLTEQLTAQQALSKHDAPVLTSTVIYQRLMPIADLSAQLMKVRKPAEKPKPKASKAAKRNATAGAADNETEADTEAAGEDSETSWAGGASGEAGNGEADSANGGAETEAGDEADATTGDESAGSSRPSYDEL